MTGRGPGRPGAPRSGAPGGRRGLLPAELRWTERRHAM